MTWKFHFRGNISEITTPEQIGNAAYYLVDVELRNIYGYTAMEAIFKMLRMLVYSRKSQYVVITTEKDLVGRLFN